MERQTMVIAIAVAGAVAVGMVSCATRCVASRVQDAETPAVEAPATEEEVPVTRWRIPEPEGITDGLRTRAWEAADGSGATLSVRGGTLVERSAAGDVAVTAFQVLGESEGHVGVRCVGPEGATFEDDLRLEYPDPEHSQEEERYLTIGLVHDVLTVVYCDRENAATGEMDIRIISARLATKLERNAYNNSVIGRH